MRRTTHSALWAWSIASTTTYFTTPAHGQTASTFQSKRGLAYLGDTHTSDENLLLSTNSAIDWYYTWSAYPVAGNDALPFVPLIHGLDDAAATTGNLADTLNSLPASSTHLLTFNEPDGTTSSGGSAIQPSAAARAYLDDIVPLRTRTSARRSWHISHPATTGSASGLAWLQDFNASCWALNPTSGCPTDFVALHWYGDFAGLAAWLGTLRAFYAANASSGATADDMPFWITEMALPQADADQTVDMLNQSISYLDSLDYVAAYAWYGADRKGGSWAGYTGGNVAMFSSGGKLTDVGALYLGGKDAGFKAGMTGGAGGVRASALVVAITFTCVVVNLW